MALKFKRQKERFEIKSVIKEDAGYEKITEEIDKYRTVVLGNLDLKLRDRLFNYAYENRKRIYLLPSMNDIIERSSHVIQMDDSILHLVKDRIMSLEEQIVKRLFDIVFSLLFLILTLPITLITAILIKSLRLWSYFLQTKT